MRRSISHRFVEFIPEQLEGGVMYISTEYATVAHKCLCGCGKEVVTSLSPTDWTLTYDGESVSLDPSVGNWSFPCRSHYWIRQSRVDWCGDMPQALIDAGRARDRRRKDAYYSTQNSGAASYSPSQAPALEVRPVHTRGGFLSRVFDWLRL